MSRAGPRARFQVNLTIDPRYYCPSPVTRTPHTDARVRTLVRRCSLHRSLDTHPRHSPHSRPSTASLRHHHPPDTLDQRPPNCPLERPEAPGPQATRLAMGNVGSRLDDGSPLYLKDQTRCKRQEATACMVACARVFADPPRQSSFRLFISPTPEAKHCYASLPTHFPRLGILHTKILETTPRWSTCR